MPENSRLHYRQRLRSLAYVQLDSRNAGIIRDVSQAGAAVQVLTPFHLHQRVCIGLDLPNPRVRFEAEGRVVWTDPSGQAGVEFLALASRSNRLLKEWLFTQLLTDAASWAREEREELLFSKSSRTAIPLHDEPAGADRAPVASREAEPIGFLGFTVSPLKFSRLVDGMVLTCAVWLFSLLTLLLTDSFPRWPLAVAFLAGLAALFGLLYWFVFAVGFGITPGKRLAELASCGSGEKAPPAEAGRARFR